LKFEASKLRETGRKNNRRAGSPHAPVKLTFFALLFVYYNGSSEG
jgi:hypothetical protein